MENVPLFDAITILVGVSVFSTGFLSVRMHAKRERLLERINQISQHLKDPTSLQGEQYNYGHTLILEEFNEYRQANQPDIIAVATAVGNFGVFLLVLFLSGLIIVTKGWQFTFALSQVVPEFWGLAVIALVELGIAVLGAFDIYFIHRDIANRLNSSFAMNLSNAFILQARDQFDRAIGFYDTIVQYWPETHLSFFLRGKAYLDEAATRADNDPLKAQYNAMAHDDFIKSSEQFASSTIFYFASEASLKTGDYKQAVLEATRAIILNPNNARAYLARASAHKKLGDIGQAQRDRREARNLNPGLDKAIIALRQIPKEV